MTMQFSRSGKRAPAGGSGRRSLKAQQHAGAGGLTGRTPRGLVGRRTSATSRSVDIRNLLEGKARHGIALRGLRTGAPVLELPRKEVIQPHLPVRLPCYDFTPVTGPTFDGSLPKGLGHRLRVLPASVV